MQQVLPRTQQDPRSRLTYLVESLCGQGTLEGTLRVPDTVGPITLTADLRARQVSASVDVPAPQDEARRPAQTWLLRQISDDVHGSLVVESWPRHARQPITATLAQFRRGTRDLLEDPERRDVLRYRLVLRADMGIHRKAGGKSPGFVDTVVDLLERVYGSIVQHVVPWAPKAPPSPGKPAIDETTEAPEPVDTPAEVEEAIEEAVDRAEAQSRSIPPAEGEAPTDDAPDDDLVPASPPWANPWASNLTD